MQPFKITMKYLYLLTLALALTLFSCAPTMTGYNQYDRNGLQQGWWLMKNDTACIQVVKYKHGFRNGISKTVYNNGQYAVMHYMHGKLNGKAKIYSNDGHLTEIKVYRNDSVIHDKLQSENYIDWKKYRRM